MSEDLVEEDEVDQWSVWKFGGTSVGCAKRIVKVFELIWENFIDITSPSSTSHHHHQLVIVSAICGITDKLERCCSLAQQMYHQTKRWQSLTGGDSQNSQNDHEICLKEIETYHLEIVQELSENHYIHFNTAQLFRNKLRQDVIHLLKVLDIIATTGVQIEILKEQVTGCGELWSAFILWAVLDTKVSKTITTQCVDHQEEEINLSNKNSIQCFYLDAREVLILIPNELVDSNPSDLVDVQHYYYSNRDSPRINTKSSSSTTTSYQQPFHRRVTLDWARSTTALTHWFTKHGLAPILFGTPTTTTTKTTKTTKKKNHQNGRGSAGGSTTDNTHENNRALIVGTGFICSNSDGTASTLKRNGSDYSASLFAGLLNADELTIWTDVDGIYTADPRKVIDSISLPFVSYSEAVELAYFGAKVLHPFTMHPCIQKNIPIRLRSSLHPTKSGTLIGNNRVGGRRSTSAHGVGIIGPTEDDFSHVDVSFCKAFTMIDNITLLNVEGTSMLGVPGIGSRLFTAVHEAGCSITMISMASSEHSICLAVTSSEAIRASRAISNAFYKEIERDHSMKVTLEPGCSIICAVGDNMIGCRGILGRLTCALSTSGVNVKAVAQGSSERNITIVVDSKDVIVGLNAMHTSVYGAETPRLPKRKGWKRPSSTSVSSNVASFPDPPLNVNLVLLVPGIPCSAELRRSSAFLALEQLCTSSSSTGKTGNASPQVKFSASVRAVTDGCVYTDTLETALSVTNRMPKTDIETLLWDGIYMDPAKTEESAWPEVIADGARDRIRPFSTESIILLDLRNIDVPASSVISFPKRVAQDSFVEKWLSLGRQVIDSKGLKVSTPTEWFCELLCNHT